MYMWERTVMGISVRTAETETATTPYYSLGWQSTWPGGMDMVKVKASLAHKSCCS